MLKFFRKIRRKLLEEGNLKKYLIYAVGEIVLVVMGILIALQINNWNERKQTLETEKIILNDLYKDLDANSLILQDDILQTKQMINNIQYIIEHFEENLPYSDSLSSYVRRLIWTYQLTLVSSSFESLKSSGFDLLQSNDLKLQIIKLFDHDYNSTIQWINNLGLEKYKEFRLVLTEFPRGEISNHYEEFLTNDKLYNLLVSYKGWKGELVNRETILLENTTKLREMVMKELKNKYIN